MFFRMLQLSQARGIHYTHEISIFRGLLLVRKTLYELPLFACVSICTPNERVVRTFIRRHHLPINELLECLEALHIQHKCLHEARLRLVAPVQLEHEQAA